MSARRGGADFFKTTVIGGLLFMVPLVILIVIVAEAIGLMLVVAEPMAEYLPVDSIAGVALANVIAVLALIVVCFVAGLLARRARMRAAVESLETKVLAKLPGYVLIKGMLSGLEEDDTHRLYPVLAAFGDVARIGLEIERTEDGRVVVMAPSSPNPWSGVVYVMSPEHVQRLDLSMAAYVENVERFGQGMGGLLNPRPKDSDSPPASAAAR